MSEIYTEASCVYSWLGEADQSTASAFQTLCEMAGAIAPGEVGYSKDVADVLEHKTWDEHQAFGDLFAREYWTRVWIQQEILLARDLYVLCGPYIFRPAILPVDSFGIIARRYFRLSPPGTYGSTYDGTAEDSRLGPITVACEVLEERRVIVSEHNGDSASRAWLSPRKVYNHRRECTNFRDHVYGYQALLAPESRVAVDYSQTKEELLCDVLDMIKGDWYHFGGDQEFKRMLRNIGFKDMQRGDVETIQRLLEWGSRSAALKALESDWYKSWMMGDFDSYATETCLRVGVEYRRPKK